MPKAETFEGERVLLRPIAQSDTDNIVRWRNAPNTLRFFLERAPITAESHQRWLEEKVQTGEVAQFIIVDKESGGDIGSCFIKDIDLKNQKGEFGIFIGEEGARGKGLGTDAARTLLRRAFSELRLNKVYLRVLGDNLRAVAAYERAGFSRDGTLREDYLDGGEFKDIVVMSALKSEFEKGL